MHINENDIMGALIYHENQTKKWKRAALIIFACLVLSFTHGVWARARVINMVGEEAERTNQLVARLASAVSDERFRACVEEIYGEQVEPGYMAPGHLEFDLPYSPWEVSVVKHDDGTWRVWESKDGVTWGYGDIIEPKP